MTFQTRVSSLEKKRIVFEEKILEKTLLKKNFYKNKEKNLKKTHVRANFYVKHYREKSQYHREQKKIAAREGKFYMPENKKVLFVIRVKGINKISPQSRKILELLRLNKINHGVFVKINSSTISMIKKIEKYVAYGYPSLKNIKLLIEKRGYAKIGKKNAWQRIRLSSNEIIQNALSPVGIYTIEDVIQELFTAGSRFKEVNNFLWPFKLTSPKKGYDGVGKKKHVSEGGILGNWEDSINKLIYKMN
nr:60S ribosomal protein L7 [Cryptomonas paramecium]